MHVSRRRRDQRGSRSWPFIVYLLCCLAVASARVKNRLVVSGAFFLFRTEFLMSGPTVSRLRVKKYANEIALSYIALRAPASVA